MGKKGTTGRPESSWTFNYHDLAKITGKGINAIQASRRRPGGFNPDDMESVVAWCVRNARPELKLLLLQYAANTGDLMISAKALPRPRKRACAE